MGWSGGWCAALVLVLYGACQGTPDRVRQYVGVAGGDTDGDLSVALAVQGRFAALYACTDDPTNAHYPGWLTDGGYAQDGQIRLAGGDWSFVGTLDDDHAAGMLAGPGGVSLAWSGAAVQGGDLSGLYTAYDSGCTTGVIVVDGRPAATPIVRGAWCNAAGKVHQVIITVSPLQLVDGRLPVEVPLDAGPRRLDAAPVRLPLP